MPPERTSIRGVPIDFLDMSEVVERIIDAARHRRHFQVATVNLDFLVNGMTDPEVLSILRESSLNIPDGAPLAWAGRMLGLPHATRVAGADLVPALVQAAARDGLSVFLLGGQGGVASAAARTLGAANPGLRVSAYEPPVATLDGINDDDIHRRLRVSEPHIVLVAFGHPKQEKWIHRNRSHLQCAAIGVGCSFDLIAGRQSRAPQWMQAAGLEWSYRLLHEPRRLSRRYAMDGWWVTRDLFPWIVRQRLSPVRLNG